MARDVAEKHTPAKQEQDVRSIVQSLVGAIPHTDLSLSELREERLKKYEAVD